MNLGLAIKMEPVADGMPNDVLIVEDDPIIALDFEDTLLGFGVKTVRSAGSPVTGYVRSIVENKSSVPAAWTITIIPEEPKPTLALRPAPRARSFMEDLC